MRGSHVEITSGKRTGGGSFSTTSFSSSSFSIGDQTTQDFGGVRSYVEFVEGSWMSDRFFIKRGDLLPNLVANLKNPDGTAINLSSGVTSVSVFIRGRVRGKLTTIVSGTVTIVDGANGQVRHTWSGNQTRDEGKFDCEFEILWTSGSKKQSVPADGYAKVIIGEDLG